MLNRLVRTGLPLLLLGGCTLPEPLPERVLMADARDTVVVPYVDVTAAAWLGPGRWAVIAPQEPAVGTADLRHHAVSRFGDRQNGELVQPFHIFRAGDTVYVADWQRRRLTLWSLDERLLGELPAPEGFRGLLPRARDAAGNWYFEARPAPGPGGQGNLDSAAIIRTSPDFTRSDTVGRLAPLELAEVISDGRPRLERRLLSGQDRWGVSPDGSLWIARVQSNQVEWRHPSGTRRESRQLPDRVLPITENDRQLFLRRFDPGLRPTVEQIPFAAIKPPFEDALGTREAMVWLVKSRAVGDSLREYQLVDSTARFSRYLAHRGLGRIVGIGEGEALVAEPFEKGVRLLAFMIPPAGPTIMEGSK